MKKARRKIFDDERHSCDCGSFSCNEKYIMGLVQFFQVSQSKHVVIAKHCKNKPPSLEFEWKGRGYAVYRPRKIKHKKSRS